MATDVTTVHIVGNVLLPDGSTPRSGHIDVKLSQPGTTEDGIGGDMKVGGRFRTTLLSGGRVDFFIVPNDDITPAGTTYRAEYSLVDRHGHTFFTDAVWSVNSTPVTQNIGDL